MTAASQNRVIVKVFNPEGSTVRYCATNESAEVTTWTSKKVEGLFGPNSHWPNREEA
jgi:hypothetical protein